MTNVHIITIVRYGVDPVGYGFATIFYRDSTVGDGTEVFYCAEHNWPKSWPTPDEQELAWQRRKIKNIRLYRQN